MQYLNPSAHSLCYSLNAGLQSQCFMFCCIVYTNDRQHSHMESTPSIPAPALNVYQSTAGRINRQRHTRTQSATVTHARAGRGRPQTRCCRRLMRVGYSREAEAER